MIEDAKIENKMLDNIKTGKKGITKQYGDSSESKEDFINKMKEMRSATRE